MIVSEVLAATGSAGGSEVLNTIQHKHKKSYCENYCERKSVWPGFVGDVQLQKIMLGRLDVNVNREVNILQMLK